MKPTLAHRTVDADHPWLGLESFTEATQRYFFGRDAEIADIFLRAREHPLTILYGQSGLGKTSLLGAGLIPKLKLEGYRPVIVRLRYQENVARLIQQTREALAMTVVEGDFIRISDRQIMEDIWDQTIWESTHRISTRDPDLVQAPPVLIFDQFEEAFTLGQRAERLDEVRALFTELADVIENRPPAELKQRFTEDRKLVREYDLSPTPLRIVITLREDYLSHLEAWKRTLPSLMRNRMALNLLNGPQALDAVFRPGQMEGRHLVDDDTAARIVRFVAGRSADVPLAEIDAVPPLLSLVCDELNTQRIEQGKDYIVTSRINLHRDGPAQEVKFITESGDPVLLDFGVSRRVEDDLEARSRAILQRFYERSFVGFPAGVQHFIEDRMVTIAGHRCPVSRDDAHAALTKAKVKDPAETLTTLVNRRLVSTEERGHVQWFEITHDVLVPIVKESKDKRLARQRIRRMILVSVSLLAVLGVFGGITAWAVKKQRESDEARAKADQTVAKLKEADRKQETLLLSASYADHEAASRAFAEHRELEGICYLDRALRFAPRNSDALVAATQHFLGMNAPKWSARKVLTDKFRMQCIAFSPDGFYLGVGSGHGNAKVIEAATGKEISNTQYYNDVSTIIFSPNGRNFAAASFTTAWVSETKTGMKICKAEFGEDVNSMSFSPDGRYLVAGSGEHGLGNKGEVRVIEVATGKEISKVEFGGRVNSVSFSPDGHCIAAGGNDKSLRLIEATTGKEISKVEFGNGVTSVSFSPDGHHIAAGSEDDSARIIETETGKEISKVEFGSDVTSVIFSPDGSYLAAGSRDKTARIFEAATGREVCKAEFGGFVISVSFSADGRFFAAGSWDKTARVIEATTGKEISKVEFGAEVTSVSFSPDGRFLAAGSDDDSVRVIEAATGSEVSKAELSTLVKYLSFSPDGRHLAVGSLDRKALVIETSTGKEISKTQLGSLVTSVGFSADGYYITVGSEDNTVRVIEAATGKEISKAEFSNTVTSVGFSFDGRYIVVGNEDSTARVIEAATGKEISKTEFGSGVKSVCFSSDGRYIAVGNEDSSARVIEAATGKEISRAEFGSKVSIVSFSPDGRHLAAGSWDKTARVIEAATGREISKTEFGGPVTNVSFSADSRCVTAGDWYGSTRVIGATTGKEISGGIFDTVVHSLSFSSDGCCLATGSGNRLARVFDARWHHGDSNVLSPFAKALNIASGLHFQPDGRLAPLTAEELTEAQAEVTAFIQAPAPPEAKWQHAILSWAAMTPETRTTSPWTTEPLRVAAGRWFMQATGKAPVIITDTADEAPWHPLEPLSLARLEPKPDDQADAAKRETMLTRPRFLARLTLKRLHDADENLYGRDTLAEYAAWSATILHEELHLDAEANEALAFALERTPPEKQKELLELKAALEKQPGNAPR